MSCLGWMRLLFGMAAALIMLMTARPASLRLSKYSVHTLLCRRRRPTGSGRGADACGQQLHSRALAGCTKVAGHGKCAHCWPDSIRFCSCQAAAAAAHLAGANVIAPPCHSRPPRLLATPHSSVLLVFHLLWVRATAAGHVVCSMWRPQNSSLPCHSSSLEAMQCNSHAVARLHMLQAGARACQGSAFQMCRIRSHMECHL